MALADGGGKPGGGRERAGRGPVRVFVLNVLSNRAGLSDTRFECMRERGAFPFLSLNNACVGNRFGANRRIFFQRDIRFLFAIAP